MEFRSCSHGVASGTYRPGWHSELLEPIRSADPAVGHRLPQPDRLRGWVSRGAKSRIYDCRVDLWRDRSPGRRMAGDDIRPHRLWAFAVGADVPVRGRHYPHRSRHRCAGCGGIRLLLTRGSRFGLPGSAALAGALLGTAVALKLTNGVFALGAVGFFLAGPESAGAQFVRLLICVGAAFLAFAVVGEPWAFALWERFGNPVFPYYNNIFGSPDFLPIVARDERFLPHSILDIWRYPLYWLLGGSLDPLRGSPSSELAFIDARWAAVVLGVTLFLFALGISRHRARARLADPSTGLIFAFAISYVVWLAEFGIQRYVLSLEILCGAVLLALVLPLRRRSLGLGLLLAIAVVSWRTMRVPDWGHVPWQSQWQGIRQQPLDFDGPSIVFLTVKPSLIVAASLPADTRYVGIYKDDPMTPLLSASSGSPIARKLAHEVVGGGNVRLLEADRGVVPAVSAEVLAGYGLVITDRCRSLRLAYVDFRVCEVERQS